MVAVGKVQMIGGNKFFEWQSDAEIDSSARIGAVIIETARGFCLLNPQEGATTSSIDLIQGGKRVAEKHRGGWVGI